MPFRVIVTLIIIAGIGVGTGALVFGLLMDPTSHSDDPAVFTAMGAAVLAASVAGLVAHLSGGFRALDDDR
jgi:hypothetical protein